MKIFLPFEENGLYEVSNVGEVRNSQTGAILRNYLDRNGRVCVKLNGGGTARTCSVARAVYHAHNDSSIDMSGVRVDYIDGDKQNVSSDNLVAYPIAKVSRNYSSGYAVNKNRRVMRVCDGRVFDTIKEAAIMSNVARSTIYRDLYMGGGRFKYIV